MPKKTIHLAETYRLEILDKDGHADESLIPDLSNDQMVKLYRDMVEMRKLDEKTLKLQRQGRVGTYGALRGQEAAQAGLAMAMKKGDWAVPSFREHGIMKMMGIAPHQILAYWKGDPRGASFPTDINCLPQSVVVGSQLLHAAGIGMALRMKKDNAVAIGFAGDGGSSEGDFHEALNFAGVFKARTVFFIQNNQWAISLPFKKQTAAASIAQRAHGFGIDGIQVDGNDVLASYVASKQALDQVRSGGKPFLIEALTYRMENHTTADDASKYRSEEEVKYWEDRDPIKRMKAFLMSKKLWDEEKEKTMLDEVTAMVDGEVQKLEAMSPPEPSLLFDHMYGELPWNLKEQRDELLREVSK